MNKNHRNAPIAFGPEARSGGRLACPAPFRALQESKLERLKNRLLRERLNATGAAEAKPSLRRAANEAAALAWTTGFPLLVFPTLFEEKARTAFLQAARQERIRERSRELLAA